MIDLQLKDFATETQKRYIDAVNEHGSERKAAKALGVARGSINGALLACRKNAAIRGYSPEFGMTRPSAPGFAVKGTSTYYGEDGSIKGQWVKTKRNEEEAAEVLREFVRELCQDVKPLPPLKTSPPHGDADLLACYVLGDPHFGMRAWAPEAGEDFDLDIADRVTRGAVDRLVISAPSAATALLLNLGDMFHADNQKNQTQSGHQLDVDGRYRKVQRVGLMAMVHAVRRLLEKHARVIVRINSGNHDDISSSALALMLDCYFHMEPRVEIEVSPAEFWFLEFGNVLIGSTHGDSAKGPDLPSIMATDKPEAWGRTRHRHWMVGHVHHTDKKEYRGVVVEYFRTLAARDAWHAGQGYRAGRDMQLIVMHREHGEIERHRCDVAMV